MNCRTAFVKDDASECEGARDRQVRRRRCKAKHDCCAVVVLVCRHGHHPSCLKQDVNCAIVVDVAGVAIVNPNALPSVLPDVPTVAPKAARARPP